MTLFSEFSSNSFFKMANSKKQKHMIHCGNKIFQLNLLHKTNMSFIFTHVKKLYLVETWVEGKIG